MVVIRIPDDQIRQVIIDNSGSEKVAKKMIARKDDMVVRLEGLASH